MCATYLLIYKKMNQEWFYYTFKVGTYLMKLTIKQIYFYNE